jgi:uncharacterized membrane protein YedE/YeeE
MRRTLAVLVLGLLLGYTLARLGFTDYGQVQRMFTFADARLFLTFAGAVALTAAGFAALSGRARHPPRPLHKGVIAGALLFGIGWALTGACPGAALAQLGEGQLAALVTLGGICLGTLAYRRVHARWFRWDRGGCDVD